MTGEKTNQIVLILGITILIIGFLMFIIEIVNDKINLTLINKVYAQTGTSSFQALFYDDFDDYNAGTINGQGGWVVDSNPSNVLIAYEEQKQISFPFALNLNNAGSSFHATSTADLWEGSQMWWMTFTKDAVITEQITFKSNTYTNQFTIQFSHTGTNQYCIGSTYAGQPTCVSTRRFTASTNPINWYRVGVYWNSLLGIIKIYDGEWSANINLGGAFLAINSMYWGHNGDSGIYIDDTGDNFGYTIEGMGGTTTEDTNPFWATLKNTCPYKTVFDIRDLIEEIATTSATTTLTNIRLEIPRIPGVMENATSVLAFDIAQIQSFVPNYWWNTIKTILNGALMLSLLFYIYMRMKTLLTHGI